MKKNVSNKAKAVAFGAIAFVLYLIPLAILAIYNRDKLFKDSSTSLTFFSILIIVFIIFFAKKLVKRICGVVTIAGFASLVMVILSVALKSFMDDLFMISVCSLIGAVLAWYPTRIAGVFSEYAKDQNGKLRADLTVKDVNNIIFGLFVDE